MDNNVYTARNGARYIKLANGQCRFVSGASSNYLNQIRPQTGGATLKSGIYYYFTAGEFGDDHTDVLNTSVSYLNRHSRFKIKHGSKTITSTGKKSFRRPVGLSDKFMGSIEEIRDVAAYMEDWEDSLNDAKKNYNHMILRQVLKVKINRLTKNQPMAVINIPYQSRSKQRHQWTDYTGGGGSWKSFNEEGDQIHGDGRVMDL